MSVSCLATRKETRDTESGMDDSSLHETFQTPRRNIDTSDQLPSGPDRPTDRPNKLLVCEVCCAGCHPSGSEMDRKNAHFAANRTRPNLSIVSERGILLFAVFY